MKIQPTMPVALCIGYSSEINEELSEKIAIKKFLMKPVMLEERTKTIRGILDASVSANR